MTLPSGQEAVNGSLKINGTHQVLDPTSCHSYHCKKDLKTLRLNRICSDNINLNKLFNKLENWLLEKSYSEKMVRKQVLWVLWPLLSL